MSETKHISLKEAIKLILFMGNPVIVEPTRIGISGDALIPFIEARINGELYEINMSEF